MPKKREPILKDAVAFAQAKRERPSNEEGLRREFARRTFVIDKLDFAALDDLAWSKRTSASAELRLAVKEYVQRHANEIAAARKIDPRKR